jgi:hypothetical protein
VSWHADTLSDATVCRVVECGRAEQHARETAIRRAREMGAPVPFVAVEYRVLNRRGEVLRQGRAA